MSESNPGEEERPREARETRESREGASAPRRGSRAERDPLRGGGRVREERARAEPRRSRTLTTLLAIVTTILLGWVLYVGAGILQPLVIAILLATLLQPIVRVLARAWIPPPVTVIVLVGLLFLGLGRLGFLIEANLRQFLGDQTVPAAERLDPLSEDQSALASEAADWEKILESLRVRLIESGLPRALVQNVLQSLRDVDFAEGLIGSGVDFTRSLVLVVIYMLFIFAEQAIFRDKIVYIASERGREAADVLETIAKGVQRYLGVKTLVSLVTGVLAYAVLVSLQIPFALLFAFLTFLLNYIPTFGSILAAVFPTLTALAVYAPSWNKAILVVIAYLTINMLLGNFLEPKILGRELNLSPLVIVLSVVVWAGLWGPVGTLLAVPITATLQIVLAADPVTRPVAILLSGRPPRRGEPPPGG